MSEQSYQEQQSFRYTWSYWLCLAITLFFIYGSWQQLILQQHFGDKPAPDLLLIILTLLLLSFLVILHFSSLQLRLEQDSLAVRFTPFFWRWRKHLWHEIQNCNVVTYQPLGDYGGWGIRGTTHNRCYNVSGKKGLLIRFKNGASLMIGIQQENELKAWLTRWSVASDNTIRL
ncbi:hypothetical protein [Alishewanella sp. HH-ZS]|jgi:hypothetical protein|uniref:hypothetical protein n=1 Tax=Alishewanella sp. HH-ZS TaxID=1856684 RepID=UPI0008235EAA|nr:hypothetical protein [Alishewanella sp. HH-ZS]OCW96164.1 hypothetical protein A9165_12925 [Alishewanella sp. HH-ZS]